MRKWILALGVVGAFVLGDTAFAAEGPTRTEAVFDIPDPEVFAECDGFDVVLSDMHIERRSLTWYEEDEPVLEERHVSFEGTFTNSDTGTTGTYSGQFQRAEDFTAGTVRLTGLIRQAIVPGRQTLVATGIDVTDIDENLLFQAGHSLDAWYEDLCTLMA